MSLINDVLRDLARRETQASGVLSGVQVVPKARRYGRARRLSAFLFGTPIGLLIPIALLTLGMGWFFMTRHRNPNPKPLPNRPTDIVAHSGIQPYKHRTPAAFPVSVVAPAPPRHRSLESQGLPQRSRSVTIHKKPALRSAVRPPTLFRVVTRSLEIHSASPITPAEKVQLDLLEARDELRHGHAHQAILHFRAALSLEPLNSAIRLALGELEMRLGYLEAARSLLLAGIRLPGTGHRARDEQIDLLARTGDTALAWHEIQRHRPAHPADDLHYLKLRAALAQLTAHWSMAAHLYGEIVAIRPRAAWAWAGRGISLEQSSQNRPALAADRRALALGGLPPMLTLYLERRIRVLKKVLHTHEPPAR